MGEGGLFFLCKAHTPKTVSTLVPSFARVCISTTLASSSGATWRSRTSAGHCCPSLERTRSFALCSSLSHEPLARQRQPARTRHWRLVERSQSWQQQSHSRWKHVQVVEKFSFSCEPCEYSACLRPPEVFAKLPLPLLPLGEVGRRPPCAGCMATPLVL